MSVCSTYSRAAIVFLLAMVVATLPAADALAAPAPTRSAASPLFRAILPAVHRTHVPALLPTLANLRRYYATIIAHGTGHYEIELGYVPNCNGGACEYGDLQARRISARGPRPNGRPVRLAGGAVGYWLNFTCGASCGDSTITVDVGSYRYVYGLKGGKQAQVVALTNSALRAGPA